MSFPLPSPGPAGQPFQFTTIPQQGATVAKLFLKNTTAAYVYDGTTLVKVTDADYPVLTVWGVVYLDGTIYVMGPDGRIWGSDLLDPLTWTALNFIAAISEGDRPIALTRHLQYIVAFKERSTEFFYDAGAPAPGSPLGQMTSSFLEIGCATAGSIAFSDNTIFFMSTSFPKGRSVSRMDGFTPTKISTPFVDRLLNADDLSKVFSFVVKLNGHVFYVLTLVNTELTLVYDEVTGEWHRWTHLVLDQNTDATTTTDAVTGVVTFTVASHDPTLAGLFGIPVTSNPEPGHGLQDGDPIVLLGETLPITYISTTQFSVLPSGAVPATTYYNAYVETYFPAAYYTRGTDTDLILTEDGAAVYEFSTTTYTDGGAPINFKARTAIDDWGVMALKSFRRVELVGDIEDAMLQIRTSDDDYRTWANYRPVLIDDNRAQLRMLGAGRRRAHEIRHFANTPLRLIALEADFDVGAR